MCAIQIGLALAFLCSSGGESSRPPARPNIIVVMPDDIGYGDFSFLGSPIVKTPHIDALARRSVRLRNFHVSPTCAPTRAALLTGRHEFKSGVTHTIFERERMSLGATTLAQALKSAGYATGIFGKWHLGDEAAYQPGRRGFDEVFIHGGGGIGQTYMGSCGDAPGNTYFNPAILHNNVFELTDGYCTDVFFRQSLRWIEKVKSNKNPFFAYITPNAAHTPLQCPESYAKRHADQVGPELSRFYGMIENIDDNVGLLLDRLREWGLDQDTLIIFLTDNGGTIGTSTFNAGMRGTKVTPYEGGTRVPCLWSWPGGWPGNRDLDALSAHIDLFPTLAELTGAEMDSRLRRQVEGRSLLSALKGEQAAWPERYLFTHVGRWERGKVESGKYQGCCVRNDRFSLVNNKELFDLEVDPGQKHDVFAKHPEVVERLRREYERWWREALPLMENENASVPRTNPYKALYWSQFGGGPDDRLREIMDPASDSNRKKYGNLPIKEVSKD